MYHCRAIVWAVTAVCASNVQGQVVQLPTFQRFSVGTAVTVPDRGAAYLGGVRRGRYGSVTHGVPFVNRLPGLGRLGSNRGLGSETGGSHAFATAVIHDFDAMDRALLGDAAAEIGSTPPHNEMARKAAFLTQHIGRRDADGLAGRHLAEIQAAQRLVGTARSAELLSHYERGCRAEADGHFGAARCAFQLVSRRATGSLQKKAAMQLAALQRDSAAPSRPTKLARSKPR